MRHASQPAVRVMGPRGLTCVTIPSASHDPLLSSAALTKKTGARGWLRTSAAPGDRPDPRVLLQLQAPGEPPVSSSRPACLLSAPRMPSATYSNEIFYVDAHHLLHPRPEIRKDKPAARAHAGISCVSSLPCAEPELRRARAQAARDPSRPRRPCPSLIHII